MRHAGVLEVEYIPLPVSMGFILVQWHPHGGGITLFSTI